jgi:DNA-directed RNA polymerase subunit RPC12/RpoP
MDGQEMGTANQAPFRLVFDTNNYPAGRHDLTATGRTTEGRSVNSAPLNVNILSAAQANQMLVRILVPVLILVLLATVLGAGGSSWLAARGQRGRPGLPQSFGISGGAICPKCGRPFALSPLNLNMLTGKLVRCPYCGKWSIVRRASREALEAAVASETAGAAPTVADISPEEKLQKQIEESRYQ